MKLVSITASVLLASALFVTACTVTREPDGTIIAGPADGKTVEVPPKRVSQITINGDCYLKIQGTDGVDYCIPCDLEGTGYAEPCDSLLEPSGGPVGVNNVGSPPPIPYDPPSAEETAFLSFLYDWLAQENVAFGHDAIWYGFGLDQWQDGVNFGVPTALVELSDDTSDGFLKLMVIRTDWAFPDVSNGSNLEYYFLRDASDNVPDAMVIQLSGTFQQVANSMKTFFDGSFLMTVDDGGYPVFIAGDGNSITFSLDQTILWQG